MTQNKFWLVWSPQGKTNPKKRYETQELAIEAGKKLAESYPKQDVYIAPVTHHFKADVNVVETVLSEQVNEPEAEFKIGDKIYTQGKYGVIKQINTFTYSVYFDELGFQYVDKNDPTLQKIEPATDKEPEPKFKVGDMVKLYGRDEIFKIKELQNNELISIFDILDDCRYYKVSSEKLTHA